MIVFLFAVACLAAVVLIAAWFLSQAMRTDEFAPAPCWRCDGHGWIEIYSTSDEYGAPCPVCKGLEAYHAKIERREDCIPSELRWSATPTEQVNT